LGVDVVYSGTVAAAREAAILGVPAASISQFVRWPGPTDWSGAAVMAERALREILSRGCPAGTFWNVNLPALDGGFGQAPITEAPVAPDPLPMAYDSVPAAGGAGSGSTGSKRYVYAGRYPERTRKSGSDVDVAFAGNISISRLEAM
jgi:5'-nucleotidase